MAEPTPDVLLRLRQLPDDPRRPPVPPDVRLRVALKRLKRAYRLEAVEVRDAPPDDPAAAAGERYARALAALATAPPVGSVWAHRRTGARVFVSGWCLLRTTLAPAVIYCGADRVVWCLPLGDWLAEHDPADPAGVE